MEYLKKLRWKVIPKDGHFEIEEEMSGYDRSFAFATVRVGKLLNDRGAQDRARLIAVAPLAISLLAEYHDIVTSLKYVSREDGDKRILKLRDDIAALLTELDLA